MIHIMIPYIIYKNASAADVRKNGILCQQDLVDATPSAVTLLKP